MRNSVSIRVRFAETNRRAWVNVLLFSAGLALAVAAQQSQDQTPGGVGVVILYAIAFALVAAAWARDGDTDALLTRDTKPPVAAPRVANPGRKLFVLPALLFALIAFLELRDNTFTLTGTATWLMALALFLFAFWEVAPPRAAWRNLRWILKRQSRWVMAALLGVLLLGGFFYFNRLDATPAEMTSDHAEKILDTRDILNGMHPIFFERNTGREPLQFYLNALVVALGIAPLDMLALKVVGAIAGILTIPAVFLLARELFDEQVGLVAAFFFAVSIFPVAIARVGLRYPLAPLFVAWTCFFLVRALRHQSRNDFLLAGLMMGIGLNGYSPFRVMVLMVFVWCVLWLVWHMVTASEFRRFAANVVLMYTAALLVFVPLLRYLVQNPGMFSYRMATRLTSLEEPVVGNPLLIFLDNNWRALGMFNVRGDVVWVNAIPNLPVVDYFIGACFLIGVALGVYRLLRRRELQFAWLFSALFILLLPSTLALAFPIENPSVVRAGGVAPFVMIFAALPLVLMRRQLVNLGARTLADVILGGALLLVVVTNFQLYFSVYDAQYRKTAWNATEIAETLREFAFAENDWEHIYIMSTPHWVDHRAVGIHLGLFDFDAHVIQGRKGVSAQLDDPAPKLYVLKNSDLEDALLLSELYPEGTLQKVPSRTAGRDYLAFYVPARDQPQQ